MKLNHPVLYLWLAMAGMLLFMLNCSNKSEPDPPIPPQPVEKGKAQVWLTTGDKSSLFSRQTDATIFQEKTSSSPEVVVDTSVRYQEIDGFGAALTGSSAYLFRQKLSDGARQTLFTKLFDSAAGIGITYLRLTLGSSDFSTSYYTYNDLPSGQEDFNLDHFSLSVDTVDVIPMLKQILGKWPRISLMASPWSPPAWMKTNNNLKGGKLRPECYQVYANYFVRYLQKMKSLGARITSITPQNEPLHATASYPCMEMQAGEQTAFIRDYLGPALAGAGLSPYIVIYDHNWDNTAYAISVLNDAQARTFIDGTAFHGYAGDVSAMSVVHAAHPDKKLYFTEICGGTWATNFSDNLMWNMRNIFIGSTSNWSSTAIMWNLALDQYGGPHENNASTLRGIVTINAQGGQVTYNEEFYSIAHFSKFVRPGARRVAVTVPQGIADMGLVAFLNRDGSKVLVACNYGNTASTFSVKQLNQYFSYTLPAKAVVTMVWDGLK